MNNKMRTRQKQMLVFVGNVELKRLICEYHIVVFIV